MDRQNEPQRRQLALQETASTAAIVGGAAAAAAAGFAVLDRCTNIGYDISTGLAVLPFMPTMVSLESHLRPAPRAGN